jgi:hypothetical protein
VSQFWKEFFKVPQHFPACFEIRFPTLFFQECAKSTGDLLLIKEAVSAPVGIVFSLFETFCDIYISAIKSKRANVWQTLSREWRSRNIKE